MLLLPEGAPSTSDLRKEYLVYTAHDTATDFQQIETYYLPDSILVIGNSDRTEYWKDDDAQEILSVVADRMNAAGYMRLDERSEANVGLQLSYVRRVTYFVGYDNPCWWWYYPYYWAPGYWGNWPGGTIPTASTTPTRPDRCSWRWSIWKPTSRAARSSRSSGTASSADCSPPTRPLNLERTLDAVEQAFTQSPYLTTK